jgi:hypothetical protein
MTIECHRSKPVSGQVHSKSVSFEALRHANVSAANRATNSHPCIKIAKYMAQILPKLHGTILRQHGRIG